MVGTVSWCMSNEYKPYFNIQTIKIIILKYTCKSHFIGLPWRGELLIWNIYEQYHVLYT